MKTLWIVLGVLLLLVLATGGCAVSMYNGMVNGSEAVAAQWSQVENVYQRRLDLVPNMVETVKGYAKHERETLEEVVRARAGVGQVTLKADQLTPEALERFQKAQEGLSGALQRLMVVVEKYPDLKASESFRGLQATLEGTENRIAVERMRYNDVARAYNASIRRFPGNLIAGRFGFAEKPYFKAEAGSEKAPQVKF
jgi:LemA protein